MVDSLGSNNNTNKNIGWKCLTLLIFIVAVIPGAAAILIFGSWELANLLGHSAEDPTNLQVGALDWVGKIGSGIPIHIIPVIIATIPVVTMKTSFKDNDPNKLSKIGRLSAGILFLGFLVSLIGGLLVDPTSNILKNYFSTDEKTLQSLKSVIDKCTLFCLIYISSY